MAYVHLHLHSEYSLLDGAIRLADLPQRLQELGQTACALTDHGVLYGAVDFYRQMKRHGLQPILGLEAYIAPRSHLDKDPEQDRRPAHLILLACNEIGWKNLLYLDSIAFIDGFYYKPRIDLELLRQHSEGLICLSGCLSSPLAQAYFSGGAEALREKALELSQIFAAGNFYLEVQANGMPEQEEYNEALYALSAELELPLVATNDCHYLRPEDSYVQEILTCLQTGKRISDPDRMRMGNDSFYVKSEQEMRAYFHEHPEAVDNSVAIAERCQFEMQFGTLYLPAFPCPDGLSAADYLRQLSTAGLSERLQTADWPENYHKRLDYELGIIHEMGYDDYYLIVWDIVRHARAEGIAVGPGRGSGGASLVAYALGITNIDSVQYDLVFERFLNPSRVSMPDFDLDFCYERRGELIDYVAQKYGPSHVCQVITFGTMAAKAVVRDVARVLDLPYAEGDRLAKLIPDVLNIKLQEAIAQNPELSLELQNNPKSAEIFRLAERLEGMPRHASTHAAGVIISARDIKEIAPLARNDEAIVVQFDKDTIEDVGLLKFDFLGLRTMTVLREAAELIWQNHGVKVDYETMRFDDPEVYRLLGEGKTGSVFQLESSGMTSFIRDVQPQNLEDIIAIISMYRPGPMEQIPRYVEAGRRPASISYAHPLLEDILKTTKGCIIYQEQVMRIVRDLAGFSMAQADNVRRAMAKKKPELMARYEELFVSGGEDLDGELIPGAIARGVPESIARAIYQDLLAFAGYAFNKAHATGYAILAYQTAWLKTHYPAEFMAAMLNAYSGNLNKVAAMIRQAREMGVAIQPPSVNESRERFTTSGSRKICFALGAIKNVGQNAMRQLVAEREAHGEFLDFADFIARVEPLDISKKAVESLIMASALDGFGIPRNRLLAVYEQALKEARERRQSSYEGQLTLFELGGEERSDKLEIHFPELPELSSYEALSQEREMMGIFLSGHPLDDYLPAMERLATDSISELYLEQEALGEGRGAREERLHLLVLVTSSRVLNTRKGELMAFVQVEDLTGSCEMIVFPSIYLEHRTLMQSGQILYIEARTSFREDEDPKLILELAQDLETAWTAISEARPPSQAREPREASRESLPFTAPVDLNQGELKLFIKLEGTVGEREGLLGMLEYFSGGCPVYLWQPEGAEALPERYAFDLSYLPYLERRYGQANLHLA